MKEPLEYTLSPFNKFLFTLSVSRSKPAYWYSYNKSDDSKSIRLISLEKICSEGQDQLSHFRFTAGPLSLAIGW